MTIAVGGMNRVEFTVEIADAILLLSPPGPANPGVPCVHVIELMPDTTVRPVT